MRKSIKYLVLSIFLLSIVPTNAHAIELGKLTNDNLNNNLIQRMPTCCDNMGSRYYYHPEVHNKKARPSSNLNCNVTQQQTEYCTGCGTRKATTLYKDYYHFHN